MIRIREYKSGDIDAIKDSIESNIGDGDCMEASNQGLFMTLEQDGKPVAVGGLVMKDEDTAEAWAKVDECIIGSSSLKTRVRLVAAFREALDMIGECLEFPVVFAVVQDGFIKGERLVKVLGFERIDESYTHNEEEYNYYRRTA